MVYSAARPSWSSELLPKQILVDIAEKCGLESVGTWKTFAIGEILLKYNDYFNPKSQVTIYSLGSP